MNADKNLQWALDLLHEHQVCIELGIEECEHTNDIEKAVLILAKEGVKAYFEANR